VLPDVTLPAKHAIDGVRRCSLDAAHDLGKAELRAIIVCERREQKVNMVWHYHGGVHLKLRFMIVQTVTQHRRPHPIRENPSLPRRERHSHRVSSTLNVRQVPSVRRLCWLRDHSRGRLCHVSVVAEHGLTSNLLICG
jgi:hypothetical protein